MDIDPKILYEYCRPLYEQIKILLLTGGDPLITKESLPFARFMSTEYPAITLYLETNGIAFNDEWQRLAMNNLMKVHISVNASNEDVFEKGCWNEGGGIYRKIIQNIRQYMALLREHKLEVFAPDVSMVINKDTAHDVRDFVRFSLEEGLHHCMFFFDYTENDMTGNYFGCPDTSRPALKELMKLERVLAKKFFVYFRLWIPLKETEMMQSEVEDIPLDELRTEYAEILKIAESRSMKNEYKTRQQIRKLQGKKEFFFDEDWTPTIRQIGVNNKQVCFAPFKLLDIYPDNKFECCSWIIPRFKIKDVIRDNKIDWNSLYNSFDMKKTRYDMLHDDFAICQKCCPLNPLCNEVCSSHKYGYDRVE
jgi:sulfatase maturation enzyme AslB (radical SAM superfamily)